MKLKQHRWRISRAEVVTTLLLLLIVFLSDFTASQRSNQTTNPREWILVWSDEFTGANGSAVDSTKWAFDIGGKGWGNNELQTYTDRTTNAFLRNGSLNIKVLRERFTGPDKITREYTSARLLTENKFTQRYGRFEARIKVPFGQGIWPAFWMLGDNIRTAGWPKCGEIDIMEYVGREPFKVFGTLHGPGYSGANGLSAAHALSNDQKMSDHFHTFAVEWEPDVIRFYIDRVLYKTRTPADLPIGASWVFDRPFFLILNVAVGGNFPGNPDGTTVFPQSMQVDYVRVYRRAG
jgi:beta-glucanase (GH16 family)